MKRRNLIFLLLPLLLAGCQSYKKVPYLQNDLGQIASADTSTRSMTLYDARIMPKDLLTIVVSCPEEPELAEPFNLTIATPASNTGNRSLTSQPALQQYLVDNDGNVEFPVLGTIHLGGLTKGEAEQYIKDKLKSQFRGTPIVTVRMVNYKISVIGEVGSPGTFTISNEKVNIFEALAMAGDMTIYGKRNNVKLLREDEQGRKEIVLLDLKDPGIVSSPYYYLQQNDILYVEPRKSKIRSSEMSAITPWVSILSVLTSLTSLAVALFK